VEVVVAWAVLASDNFFVWPQMAVLALEVLVSDHGGSGQGSRDAVLTFVSIKVVNKWSSSLVLE
jgi:hypothetical protein